MDRDALLQYTINVCRALIQANAPCRYKIGIAFSLSGRFFSESFLNYVSDGYTAMHALALCSSDQVRLLEWLLIDYFQGCSEHPFYGCLNAKGSGGEGIADGHTTPCFLYIVIVSCECHIAWMLRTQRSM